MGIKALIFFEIVTTAALFIGLVVVNLDETRRRRHARQPQLDIAKTDWTNASANVRRKRSGARFSLERRRRDGARRRLQIVAFCVLFALAVAAVGEKGQPIVRAMGSLAQVMFKFTNYVMMFAPIGVGAAMAHTIGTQGLGVLVESREIDRLALSRADRFRRHRFRIVLVLARIPVRQFLRAVREPAALAFATTSSESALPKAMESMERFGVPPAIVGFVMPTGYSFNLTGSTLYLAMASVFVAQAAETTMGWHMGIGQQITMMLTLMLTSKGVAGVPRVLAGDFAGHIELVSFQPASDPSASR